MEAERTAGGAVVGRGPGEKGSGLGREKPWGRGEIVYLRVV